MEDSINVTPVKWDYKLKKFVRYRIEPGSIVSLSYIGPKGVVMFNENTNKMQMLTDGKWKNI